MINQTIGKPGVSDADVISLRNEHMEVSILPAAGGNIAGIIDRRSGRNWLWQNPLIPINDHRVGVDYGRQLDSGGWDEILFSISADEIAIPGAGKHHVEDHGDLIRQRWTANQRKNEISDKTCEMSVVGTALRYEFRRLISLRGDGPCMHIEYTFSNKENFAIPCYWCAHALLDVQPDMRICLPEGLPFRVEGDPLQSAVVQRWPAIVSADGESSDLSRSFATNGATRHFASKVFVQAPENGSVRIEMPDSDERLTMRFDPETLPWLGLWINNHGWSGCGSEPYVNLGIEPAMAPYDKVSEAIVNDAIAWLQPGESRDWSLFVELAT